MPFPYTDPTPTDWAVHEVRLRFPGTILGDWAHTLADGCRPMHTARVLNEDAADRIRDLAASGLAHGVEGAQQRPVLDYSAPGRLEMWWLFNGEWIVLWAPDTPGLAPVVPEASGVRETPVQPAPRTPVTPGVDAQRLIPRPGGRLRFGRRTNTAKETRT